MKITFDCYDLCIHYNTQMITVPSGGFIPSYALSCSTNPSANDIVATVCYDKSCANCVQVDCMSPSYGCGAGTLNAILPWCQRCEPPQQQVNVSFNPGTKQLLIQ